jgi:hypothetical protein
MKNINEELNKLRKKMNIHKKGLTYLLWKNKEELKEEKREELEDWTVGSLWMPDKVMTMRRK